MSLIRLIKTYVSGIMAAACLWTAAPVYAAGTVPLAMAQQIDANGQPLVGCILYFYAAGTVATPQDAYSDFGLSQNPLTQVNCDQSGRIPMFWLADGLIHIRLTDSTGLVIIDTTMQVLGPSSGGGGGGGGTVDPTTILSTGDMKWRLDKDPQAGFVRINGLTLGSGTSGATERANADTQNLYVYIWTKFSNPSSNAICPVVGGLGVSALADFNANKPITLEDARARSIFALDDMGNSALGGFTGITFTKGNATTGGAAAGVNAATVLPSWLPSITSHAGNVITVTPSIAPSGLVPVENNGVFNGSFQSASAGGSGSYIPATNSGGWGATNSFTGSNNIAVTSDNTGGLPFPMVPSVLLGTLFWKL